MATRNFVPRADGEGSIGTAAKNWFSGYFKQLNVASMTVNDNQNPIADTATLATLLSNLANMVKQNKGTDDWKTTPPTNLTTLATLAGNLASGSDVTWEGNKFTNAKLGITGLMEQNGYICFGKNFGGLILQWGNFDATYTTGNTIWIGSFTYPIKINTVLIATAMHYGGKDAYAAAVTNIATKVTSGSWRVELNGNPISPSGTIPMRAFIIGK